MNPNIKNLYDISNKSERTIIGLMSGTSLDGLDIALCKISGHGTNTQIKLINFETIEYTIDIKNEIRSIFAKTQIDFQHFCLLNSWLGSLHGDFINVTLQKWDITSKKIDVIASHGQTVFHAPKTLHQLEKFSNSTLQIGDGDHIAVKTGIITISDFRQKHIVAGGEGAPLALYGDYLLFSKRNEVRILLNIGGIANFTYLPGNDDATNVFCTDTGPGNTLIDGFMNKCYNQSIDLEGSIASSGDISQPLLNRLKEHDFFTKSFPKTTGPESFNIDYVLKCQEESATANIPLNDLIATLTRFTAETIVEAIQACVGMAVNRIPFNNQMDQSIFIYTSGGGCHNKMIMKHLELLLTEEDKFIFGSMDLLGIPGDAKEAVLFAVLANETLCGTQTHFGNNVLIPSVSMGKISFPI